MLHTPSGRSPTRRALTSTDVLLLDSTVVSLGGFCRRSSLSPPSFCAYIFVGTICPNLFAAHSHLQCVPPVPSLVQAHGPCRLPFSSITVVGGEGYKHRATLACSTTSLRMGCAVSGRPRPPARCHDAWLRFTRNTHDPGDSVDRAASAHDLVRTTVADVESIHRLL